MKQKTETCQTYRGTTQTKGEYFKPGKFSTGGFKMGAGRCNVLRCTGIYGKTRNIVYKEAW
jgi:hypothetical protein